MFGFEVVSSVGIFRVEALVSMLQSTYLIGQFQIRVYLVLFGVKDEDQVVQVWNCLFGRNLRGRSVSFDVGVHLLEGRFRFVMRPDSGSCRVVDEELRAFSLQYVMRRFLGD
jgi:hypothetical protein